MWQLFTDRARLAVYHAQVEAIRLGENYLGTEHLLIGLLPDEASVAVRVLKRLGLSPDELRSDIERQVTRGHGNLGQDMQLTPRAKRVIDFAYEEAQRLQSGLLGTGHLLLGLIREGDGLGARVLGKRGVGLERTRQEVSEFQEEERQTSPHEDIRQLAEDLSGDQIKHEARVSLVVLCADRDGVPWWRVQVHPERPAQALLEPIKARGFTEAGIAADHLIWVRPVREDEWK